MLYKKGIPSWKNRRWELKNYVISQHILYKDLIEKKNQGKGMAT